MLRIVSWNVNGVRSLVDWRLRKRAGPGGCGALADLFEKELGSPDIVCFQETKISKEALNDEVALVPGYDAFYASCRNELGAYSGVATFCKTAWTPADASGSLRSATGGAEPCLLESDGFIDDEIEDLDSEGRAVLTDHGQFVLFNLYIPALSTQTDERLRFKKRFCLLLQRKIESLTNRGRQVVLVGDFNIAPEAIDCCDSDDSEDFDGNFFRLWLHNLFRKPLLLVDSFRWRYPGRQNAFSCWNSKTSARETNYGARIDLMLFSSRLKSAVTDAEIHPDVMGSDHCPTSICFDLYPQGGQRAAHPFCVKFLPHLSMKQTKLSSVLGKDEGKPRKTIAKRSRPVAKVRQSSLLGFVDKLASKQVKESLSLGSSKSTAPTTAGSTAASPTKAEKPSAIHKTHSIGSKSAQPSEKAAASAWKTILRGSKGPPKCHHGEPCVFRVVKKDSTNVGKGFFVCSRPQGLKTDVKARCDWFSWA